MPVSGVFRFFVARSSALASCLRLVLCAVVAFAPQASLLVATAEAQCCGEAVAAPVATQTYRIDVQTVYDEEQVTAKPSTTPRPTPSKSRSGKRRHKNVATRCSVRSGKPRLAKSV